MNFDLFKGKEEVGDIIDDLSVGLHHLNVDLQKAKEQGDKGKIDIIQKRIYNLEKRKKKLENRRFFIKK